MMDKHDSLPKGTGSRERPDRPAMAWLAFWCPKEMERPVVRGDLFRLGPVERVAEVIRYSLRRAEYWVSPNGWLCEWFRLNLWIAIVLAIPAILVAPLSAHLLDQMETGTGRMAGIAQNLAQLPEALRSGIVIMAVVAVIFVLKFIFR